MSSSCLRSRLGVVLLVLAVALGIFPATAFVSPQAASADTLARVPDTAPDETTAARYAGQARKRIQVMDQTTETTETFANPDGTFTLNRHVRPVRVGRGGGWVAPDSTFVAKDGALVAKATTAGISLSAGRPRELQSAGGQPLLRLDREGTTTGFDWAGPLPAPVVDGATATYPEVLPGVDLKIEADVDTVHEVVVVKTPEAAKNVAKIGFDLPVRGGTVSKDADGTLHVRDAKGADKFSAPPATMWDSSGIDVTGRDFVRGPAPGGRRVAVGEDLAGTKLTLTPDQGLLTAATTAYPVYVDPTWHDTYCGDCGRNHYLVQYACGSGKTPGDAVWDSDDNLRAGYYNDPYSSCSGHLVTARSFVEMNLGGLSGKLIYGAKLNLALTNPGKCWADNNIVWAGAISSGLRFGSGPPWWNTVATVSGCPTNVGFDITDTIRSAVGGNSPTWTFGIVSPDENNQDTWKRYSPQVDFSVIYNSPPQQPTNLAIFNGTQAYPCVQGASRPVLGPTGTGYVTRANVSDPDGNDLYAGFRVYKGLVSKGGYTWDGQEFGIDNVASDADPANRNAAVTLPTTEMNTDGFYSWDVHSTDGRETSWAVPCEVEIELTPPAAPAVASQTYPAGAYGGGPGRAGDFTFTVANSPTTVDHYVWKLDNTAPPSCDGTEAGTVKPQAFNGPGTAAIAPGSSGPHVLSAWACNRAKTPSTRVDYSFIAKDASAPVASWQFEGNGRSQIAGLRYAGAGRGTFGAGKLGQAAAFSGQTGDYFTTPARIVDTTKSFSVSAWVNAADLSSGRRAVLTQDGDQTSGFALQYLETGKWAFSLSSADVAAPAVTSAVSTVAPTTGTWSHLTGVYDAAAHTASLYVDGSLQQTVSATAPNVSGPLVLGGAKAAAARAALFKGSIDEAAVFGRALTSAEVGTLYGNGGVPTGLSAAREYKLDGDTSDATGTEGTLTLNSLSYGPGYSDSAGQSATEDGIGHGTGQALVNQGSGHAATSSPVVDSTQSFSVSAWVKLDRADFFTVVAQEGTAADSFLLSSSPDNFGFGLSRLDTAGDAADWRWAGAPIYPYIGKWTHLAGVYDVAAGKERLYINGALVSETVIPAGTTWRSTGPFGIAKQPGQQFGAFAGAIDQVQVWDRPLPAAEVAELANTAVLRANYQLDGTMTDSVSGVTGTPSGNVRMTTDENGAKVARFPFEWGSQIEGPRPQNFRSDRSFTVEAWVKHAWTDADAAREKQRDPSDPAGVDKPGRTALAANSAQFSPYLLGYRGVQDANSAWHPRWSWTLFMAESTPSKPVGVLVTPDVDAQSNVWTHLAGTYDAVTHTACLYATTDSYQYSPKCVGNVTAWNGASDLEDLFLGRGRWSAMDSDYWYGDLRGIRVYSGVLDQQHINADALLDHP